jgi:hypothetical protein
MSNQVLYAATNEKLLKYALEPTFRWLIAAALDGTVMTYGDIKKKLEDEIGFSTIFATRIGFVAGSLMEKIQTKIPKAPLINVLVVNQMDRQPSHGAGGFMAYRFRKPLLKAEDAKQKYPQLWKESFERAAAEVYEYGPEEWAKIYKKVFNVTFTRQQIAEQREKRKRGTEQDGDSTGHKYGSGGEGEFHRSLRLWIMDHPKAVHASFAGAETETELSLESGDRVDVMYRCSDRIVLLEVKSRISNDVDLIRGVYQCIKYRAVREAMDVRHNPVIETYLITETELPGDIAALLRLHKIKHFLAPQVRK